MIRELRVEHLENVNKDIDRRNKEKRITEEGEEIYEKVEEAEENYYEHVDIEKSILAGSYHDSACYGPPEFFLRKSVPEPAPAPIKKKTVQAPQAPPMKENNKKELEEEEKDQK